MSRTSRILAGAVLAAVAGLALAAPAAASSASVSFSGASPLGLPLLSCASSPDRSSVSITTDDTLNVQNLTGHQAYVYINGSKTTHQVGPNQGVPITFPAGSWTVAMAPNCLLNLNDAGTVNVTVAEPARAVTPEPTPTHTADPAPTHTSAPSKSSAPAPRNAGSTTSTSTTAVPSPKPSAPAAGTSGSTAPGSASGGSGTSGHGAPGSGVAATGAGGAAGSGAASKRSGSGSVVAGAAGQQVNIGAAQALPAADSVPATPNYLLAVIALISILGVGSATVRALTNQRAARRAAY